MFKLYAKYPSIVLVSAFLPYVSISLGLKMDSIVVFLFGLIFLLYALFLKKDQLKISMLIIFVAWLTGFFYLFTRTLFSGNVHFVSFAAEIKNFAQPLAILIVFIFVFSNKYAGYSKELIVKSCTVLVYLLCLNTLWAILSVFNDLSSINQWFWGGAESVASRAMANGRFTGIFNQPLEAGVSYSVGLFAWTYLIESKALKIKPKSTLMIILIVTGGLLTVSKVFLFGGLILFLATVALIKEIRKKIIPIVIFSAIIGYPVYNFFTNSWEGLGYLLRFFGTGSQQNGIFNLITAGRYGGQNSQQELLFSNIWKSSPVFGEGLGSQEILDSGFYHFFSTGGIIGFGFYLIILISLVFLGIRFVISRKFCPENKLFISVVILVLISSFGGPVLTLSRASIIIWLFIAVLINFLNIRKQEVYMDSEELSVELCANTPKKGKRKLKKYRIVW